MRAQRGGRLRRHSERTALSVALRGREGHSDLAIGRTCTTAGGGGRRCPRELPDGIFSQNIRLFYRYYVQNSVKAISSRSPERRRGRWLLASLSSNVSSFVEPE
mmetsp:Transcript_83836/g.224281  ORF Transcript_83836/g.224281 Transcript_83836/m.224281 type:complete len:104 (-) Transcript_83836:433-744(-)